MTWMRPSDWLPMTLVKTGRGCTRSYHSDLTEISKQERKT